MGDGDFHQRAVGVHAVRARGGQFDAEQVQLERRVVFQDATAQRIEHHGVQRRARGEMCLDSLGGKLAQVRGGNRDGHAEILYGSDRLIDEP
ncbi:hypothetical protein ALP97_200216 [Pseudomonas salomonii]|uniref:Uncharacterized protein n=1 Tax=Pseudomonas salomonii TaxID=191391 RepID=A0A3M4QLF2_9PSED|nr:hypothetical protein ALP97_200216 [Pseudomonas salomonii]